MPLAAGPTEQEMVERESGIKEAADFAPSTLAGDVGLCPMTAPGWQSVREVGRQGQHTAKGTEAALEHTAQTSGTESRPPALCAA